MVERWYFRAPEVIGGGVEVSGNTLVSLFRL